MVKKKDLKILKEFKKNIAKTFLLKKLILFGSRATGKTHKWSDFDLLVVSDAFKQNRIEEGAKLYNFWKEDYPVDFLCYTPEEFNRLKKQVTIVREAVTKGVEI